ncbi:putative K+/H+ antiporter [Dipodascopsis uninucleata]
MAVNTSTVAGVISGRNPVQYSASTPYTLFLLQALIIILLALLINVPLRWIKQPKVIGEVIAGIILGPSVMGHIPNFTQTIFPAASIPGLTLIANVSIILFLFVVGLEVDIKFLKKNAPVAVSVGLVNMAIPFAVGCGLAKGLYNEYRANDDSLPYIKFTTYMVFIATAMCITALPVLARILRELRVGTSGEDRVFTVVLAAGIFNDLLGWILLALSVTLVNASKAINTLYILLVAAGWFLLILYPVRIILCKLIPEREIRSGPTTVTISIIISIVFVSAFFTDIIGVHPIFGAFMVGLIIPREHHFSELLMSKIDDLISSVFIPLYFALAGQSVNLGLLNKGIDWAYIVGIVGLSFFTKVIGGIIASHACGLYPRESLTIGVLMSCKGIVEIVVLTVGLNAQILSEKVFSMFIVMTLVCTFLTTPLTKLCYPQSYRDQVKHMIKAKDAAKERNNTTTLTEAPVEPIDEAPNLEGEKRTF